MTGYLDTLVFVSRAMFSFQPAYLSRPSRIPLHIYTPTFSLYSQIYSVILINRTNGPYLVEKSIFVTHALACVCHPLFLVNHLVRALYRSYINPHRPLRILTASGLWLRSSVVSVLNSLTTIIEACLCNWLSYFCLPSTSGSACIPWTR